MNVQQIEGEKVQRMFGSIAGRYDLTNAVLSFGMHHYWRWRLLSLVKPDPSLAVLDACTGTGDLLPHLAKRFGKVTGIDFCEPMVEIAKKRFVKSELNIEVQQADALALPFADQSFDLVTVAYGVRNLENLQHGLQEMHRVLRDNGKILILEFGQPEGWFFGTLYRFYSRFLMPRIGGFLTGNREAYEYLPQTASEFPCGTDFESELERAGFASRQTLKLTGGIAYAYLAAATRASI